MNTKNIINFLILSSFFCISIFCTTPKVEVSFGEFLDKISILKIKTERIDDNEKLKNIRTELKTLKKSYNELIKKNAELEKLEDQLKNINEDLWEIEDAIRDKEFKKEFDDEFIKLARSVYFKNDDRSKIKKEINSLLGSDLVEEKSYKNYQ